MILATSLLILMGCDAGNPPGLVVVTTWSPEECAPLEAVFRARSSGSKSIDWVRLDSGESLTRAIQRRGGVDLILGAPAWRFEALDRAGQLVSVDSSDLAPWRLVTRSPVRLASFRQKADPRDDPASFAEARSSLRTQGWSKGYEALVRETIQARLQSAEAGLANPASASSETIALVKGGRNPAAARKWIDALQAKGLAKPDGAKARNEAIADSLIADLLGAALFDASRELRDAGLALVQFNHPSRAESSLGEVPPWPPASVWKLREGPNGEALVETLLEQVAPEPAARDWLRQSWLQPKRAIDDALLSEIAAAANGRLAAEPRFRAWLRAEWTAWTRQLYRRVARLAGGYVPS